MSNILEDLLLETKRAKQLAEEQTKTLLEKVMGDNVQEIIKESVKTKDSTKSTVLTVNEEIGDDTIIGDTPDGMGDAPDMGDDTAMDIPSDIDGGDTTEVDLTGGIDTDDIDLSEMSMDDMLDKLKELLDNGEIDDETEIIIKQNPKTFDVNVNGDASDTLMASPADISADVDGDVSSIVTDDDTDVDVDLSGGEEEDDDLDKAFESYEFNAKIDESEKITNLQKIVENYEKDLKQFKSTNKQLVAENNTLTKNCDTLTESLEQYKQVMVETKKVVSDLVLNNTNLLHITSLFTEGVYTAKDKITVVESFEKVKTIGESKVLFEALKMKSLPKEQKHANVIETKVVVKETVEQDLIKEEKTYSDPIFDMMKKISKRK